MANTLAPFGFAHWGTASGPVNFASEANPPYRIASGYGTAIYFGDLVRMNVSGPTGYLEQWAAADGGTATKIPVGIFAGCQFYSSAMRQTIVSNFWPGSGATGDVTAFVITDPNAEFKVQAGVAAVPFTQAMIGQSADIVAAPTGNATTGISGMSLDTPTTTATFPFKVVNLVTTPPGANGTDIATAYNYVIVAFNNQMFKNPLGV